MAGLRLVGAARPRCALTAAPRNRLFPRPQPSHLARELWRKPELAHDDGLPLETRVSRLLAGRTLVMVGMMGAGKSSIGRRLANRLGMAFVDADSRDRTGRQRHHPGDFRAARRGLFPRRRAPRHPAPARRPPQGPGDRRRRLHPAGDPRRHPGRRHLDLAEGRPRPPAVARQAPQQPAAAQGRRSRGRHRPADRRALPDLCRGRHPHTVARRRPRRRHRRHTRSPRRLSQPRGGG